MNNVLTKPTVLVLIISCIPTVFSIHCYKCSTANTKSCVDPIQSGIQPVDCNMYTPPAYSCKKMLVYRGNNIDIIRDCVSQGEKEDGDGCFRTNKGDDYCRCSNDYCNDGNSLRLKFMLQIITLSLLTLVIHYNLY